MTDPVMSAKDRKAMATVMNVLRENLEVAEHLLVVLEHPDRPSLPGLLKRLRHCRDRLGTLADSLQLTVFGTEPRDARRGREQVLTSGKCLLCQGTGYDLGVTCSFCAGSGVKTFRKMEG